MIDFNQKNVDALNKHISIDADIAKRDFLIRQLLKAIRTELTRLLFSSTMTTGMLLQYFTLG